MADPCADRPQHEQRRVAGAGHVEHRAGDRHRSQHGVAHEGGRPSRIRRQRRGGSRARGVRRGGSARHAEGEDGRRRRPRAPAGDGQHRGGADAEQPARDRCADERRRDQLHGHHPAVGRLQPAARRDVGDERVLGEVDHDVGHAVQQRERHQHGDAHVAGRDQRGPTARAARRGRQRDDLHPLAVAAVHGRAAHQAQQQPRQPGRSGEQRDLHGGPGQGHGVQRDADLDDAVGEVRQAGRGEQGVEAAAERFAGAGAGRAPVDAGGVWCMSSRCSSTSLGWVSGIAKICLQRSLCKGNSAIVADARPPPGTRGAQGLRAPAADRDVRVPGRPRAGHGDPAGPGHRGVDRADQLPPAPARQARVRRGRPGAHRWARALVAPGRVHGRRPTTSPTTRCATPWSGWSRARDALRGEQVRRWLERMPTEAPEWRDVSVNVDGRALMTAAELDAMTTELSEVLDRHLDAAKERRECRRRRATGGSSGCTSTRSRSPTRTARRPAGAKPADGGDARG